jgi:hypothetical protein
MDKTIDAELKLIVMEINDYGEMNELQIDQWVSIIRNVFLKGDKNE